MIQKLKWAAGIVGVLVAIGVFLFAWSTEWFATFGGVAEGAERERMEASPNFDVESGLFVNPVPTEMMSFDDGLDTLPMWLDKPEDSVPPAPLPFVEPDFSEPESGLKLTWLGHSTYVIQLDGATILTDPVIGERASPSNLTGPKRFHAFPCAVEDLPKLDAVIISHDHYDHLDYYAIQALTESSTAPFLVPLGVGAHLREWGVPDERIITHDWWDETKVGEVRLVSTPSRHFSGRRGYDQFTTLWTSWSLVGPEHRVFFSGDTGYFDGLKEIAEKLGPFDVGMYEIGAYHDNWGSIHLGPAKTMKAHELMHSKLVVPIHWGTFDLGLHSWWEPPTEFEKLAKELGIPWSIAAIGGSIEPGANEPRETWWNNASPVAEPAAP